MCLIKVKLHSLNATIPKRATTGSAGLDLYAAHDVTIPARSRELVSTDVSIELPEGTYGRIASTSRLSYKYGVEVGAGVIDSDYRGVLKVVLYNHADTEFTLYEGNKIAQLICESILTPEVQIMQQLTSTIRGEGGFGSTHTQ